MSGIEYDKVKQELYIADKDKAVINVYDKNFKKVKSYEHEKLQFPSNLLLNDKDLLVLCSETSRLFHFDNKEELVEIFDLPPKDKMTIYTDMELMDERVYITVNTPETSEAKILELSLETGESKYLGDKFVSFVVKDNSDIYFVNSLVPVKGSDFSGFDGGKNSLHKLNKDSLEIKGDFIEKTYPGDLFFEDDMVYVYTAGFSNIDIPKDLNI